MTANQSPIRDDTLDQLTFLFPSQFETLWNIRLKLYGDGRALTPDERRGLANALDILLHKVKGQTLEEHTP